MSVKERLIEFIRYKKLSNSEFCRSIRVSTAFVSSMVKSIQPDKIERITLKYPELNIEWLLTGEGMMLKSSIPPVTHSEMIPISIVKMMDDERKRFDAQRDEMLAQNRMMLTQNQTLIDTVKEQTEIIKKGNVPPDGDAECADASGSDLEK